MCHSWKLLDFGENRSGWNTWILQESHCLLEFLMCNLLKMMYGVSGYGRFKRKKFAGSRHTSLYLYIITYLQALSLAYPLAMSCHRNKLLTIFHRNHASSPHCFLLTNFCSATNHLKFMILPGILVFPSIRLIINI